MININSGSLLQELQNHPPHDTGYCVIFSPNTCKIPYSLDPCWSHDLTSYSGKLERWNVKEFGPEYHVKLAKYLQLGEIWKRERDFPRIITTKSSFMIGRLDNEAVIFHSIEPGWDCKWSMEWKGNWDCNWSCNHCGSLVEKVDKFDPITAVTISEAKAKGDLRKVTLLQKQMESRRNLQR